ncbi:sugar phosphate isomerase/epimerase family protein [Paenibacillus sepulcri]|uniref:Sugar phosphate isomerase/epimerase n=1 Tax=Paenibacillus sepulcri TaxID=359917 RepID=A0ABS7C9W2_9BACL|nr:sugar phosphate isomerase/epimerase [Paenibacillus sepulcri]
MIRLGGSIPGAGGDPQQLARAYREFGYRAAICPEVEASDSAGIRSIRDAFAGEDILIAEVGCWSNLVDSDEARRRRNLNFAYERLNLAEEVGALCCITYIGSAAANTQYDPHPFNLSPEGFELAVDTVRGVIDTVKPKRARFALEFMQWVLPDSPEACLDLIKAVDRPQFAAHLDPVNIILTPRQYFSNGELIKRCFELLGPYIVSCHAKDIKLGNKLSLHLDETLPGTGNLDYGTYLRELNKLPGEIPLLLEHLHTVEEYAQARDHLTAVGRDEGILFYGAEQ